jgi:hypothetical protein
VSRRSPLYRRAQSASLPTRQSWSRRQDLHLHELSSLVSKTSASAKFHHAGMVGKVGFEPTNSWLSTKTICQFSTYPMLMAEGEGLGPPAPKGDGFQDRFACL